MTHCTDGVGQMGLFVHTAATPTAVKSALGNHQCSSCHHQTSVISGTIFAATKLPLRIWFLGIYLVTQPKNGISALELMRQLGIT